MVQFDSTREEIALQRKVCERLEAMGEVTDNGLVMCRVRIPYDRLTMMMDLDVANSGDNRQIDFQRLLDSSDSDFLHDVLGIKRHIDRETGEMTGCFCPRSTKMTA